MTVLHGIPSSDGVAVAPVLIYQVKPVILPEGKLSSQEIPDQLAALEMALVQVKADLTQAAGKAKEEIGQDAGDILDAHIGILDDPDLLDCVRGKISDSLCPAARAVWEAGQEFSALFEKMDDPYLRARGADISDVANRLARKITGQQSSNLAALPGPRILVGHDIAPSDTASMDKRNVVGIISETGSRTSHAVILARSLGIPAVVGVPGALLALKDGEQIILNGTQGTIISGASPKQLLEAQSVAAVRKTELEMLRKTAKTPAITRDGATIQVQANIGSPADAATSLEFGADGVGLFRSEFFYMGSDDLPDEQTQYEGYLAAAKALGEKPLIVRTMDIGGDKKLPCLPLPQEMNPFLGYRAIRICLDRPELFRPQIRALLRAAQVGNLSIMLPMIGSIGEIRQAKALIDDCKQELRREGVPFREDTPVGIMVEIPSIALQAEAAARYVDFFSIGTNDLMQYTLAVDRMNEKVAPLYQPFHPGVLSLIERVIWAGANAGIHVGMCGEMAGMPAAIPLLLGMGLENFSMSAASIPQAKDLLRKLSRKECQTLAEQALACDTAEDVNALVVEFCTNAGLLL